MNEKIKELMLRHGVHKHISEDCHSRIEFISNEIVKECARVAREYTLRKSGVPESFDGTVYIENEILNHFGVT